MRIGSEVHKGKRYLIHAHVIAEASPEVSELLRFRDRLRAAYEAEKRRILAAAITDRQSRLCQQQKRVHTRRTRRAMTRCVREVWANLRLHRNGGNLGYLLDFWSIQQPSLLYPIDDGIVMDTSDSFDGSEAPSIHS